MGLTDFRPFVKVTINGIPVSGFVFSAISSVRVTDTVGIASDTADVTWANSSVFGRFAMPEPGAVFEIGMGYLGNFRPMGVFVADEVEEGSAPRSITAMCQAQSLVSTESGLAPIQQQKSRSWPAGLTLLLIVETIAGENGLTAAVTDAAAALVPGHLDQIDESDISLLSRVAAKYDLIAKPAGGSLFVGRRADSLTASGAPMPTIPLLERDCTNWLMRRGRGDGVGSVVATYRDFDTGVDAEVTIGDGVPVRRLRHVFASEEEASVTAEAELRRSSRAVEHLEVVMPGNPAIAAEGTILPADFSAAASGPWVVLSATHSISEAGYQTVFQAERPE